jgi:acyl-CoA reductase-like NAD-dependent aldehyde dehydrogenase
MSAATIRSTAPSEPSELVGEYAVADATAVASAVAKARDAQREWLSGGASARASALAGAAQRLRTDRDAAVALVVREVGKPLVEARGEVARAIAILDYYAQSCYSAVGEQYPPSLGGLLYTERRPRGVAGLITPWNFPLAIPTWKAAPALAAGNAVVLKPSPEAPACAALLHDVLVAELPPGVFSLVNGHSESGEALVASADVISFTGSRRAGRAVAFGAAGRMIPAQCEMGGQNAAIILPDADPTRTANAVAAAAMGYAGQKCTATRRVIVVGDSQEITDALVEAIRRLPAAAPEDPGSVVGPVITAAAQANVEAAIVAGREAGGSVLAQAPAGGPDGWYVAPTLLGGVPAEHALAREETFGPLALLLRAVDLDEALAIAAAVPYGLVTSIHGRDLTKILTAVAGVDTGLIKVNAPTTGVDFYAPFGGEKDSSYGPREQGRVALDFYSTSRTVTIAPG